MSRTHRHARWLRALGLSVSLLLPLTGSWAQSAYPNKPVRIVVQFAAGGGSDTLARAIADGLSRRLGQPVIVENKAGAGGIIGADAIAKAMQQAIASAGPEAAEQAARAFHFLEVAQEIAAGHHEKWDGSGYPRGLSGNAIPLSARLMALADVFDALVCKRHYKEAFPIEKSIEIIRQGRGQHFDPRIVDVFLANIDACIAIAERHADHPPHATA